MGKLMVKLQQLYFYTWVGKTVQARNTIVEYIHADSSSAGCWEAKLTTQNGCDTWGIKQTVFAGYMYVYVYIHINLEALVSNCPLLNFVTSRLLQLWPEHLFME
jgi:hypothetical protein